MTSEIAKSASVRISNDELSFQVYQDIYNSITGRSERVSKFFLEPHVLKIGDVRNLNYMLEQMLEQYQHSDLACRFAVSYVDGTTETFSGMERFVLQAPAAQQVVHDIDITYSFFLVLPQTQEPKSYQLTVSLRSEVAAIERLEQTKATFAEKQMYFSLSQATSKLEIEYVDLAVARNIEQTLGGWYNALPKRNVTLANLYRRGAKLLLVMLRPMLYLGVTAAFLYWTDFVDLISESNSRIVMFFVCSLFLVAPLSIQVEKLISNWKNLVGCHSFISFSEADERLEVKHSKKVGFAIIKSLGSCAASVILSLIATYLAISFGIN